MIQRIAWFERKFIFDFPVRMYPNVIERLRGTPARLDARLRSLSSERLTGRAGSGWSVQEHAGHLLDLSELDIARLADYEAGVATLRAADLENRKTFAANHNDNSVEKILAAFGAERAEFVRRLEEYDEAFVQRTAVHPRLQMPLRVVDFAFFVAEHDDHHLAAITELLRR